MKAFRASLREFARPGKRTNSLFQRDSFLIFILLLLALLVYSPAMNARLFFDDEYYIVRNTYVHDLANLPKLFTTAGTAGSGFFGSLYRPLQFVFHSFVYHFFGTTPLAYHLLSVLVHVGCSVLLFYLLREFGLRRTASFFAGLLFLVHPANAQAVSYVSGLGDPLGLFFVLSAILVYRKDRLFKSRLLQYMLFALLIGFSLLSKERSIVFLGLFFIADMAFPKRPEHGVRHISRYPFYTISIAATALYVLIRKSFLDFGQIVLAGLSSASGAVTVFYTFLYAFWEYLVAVFFPVVLYSEHPVMVFSTLSHPGILISLAVLMILGTLSMWKYKSEKMLFFCFFWFLAALLPTSGIVPMAYTMKEHWIYYSMAGFSAGASFYFFRFAGSKKAAVSVFLVICLILGARGFARNIEWSDPKLFFQTELKYNPDSENAIANLAYEYYLEGDIDSAISLYRRGIEVAKTGQLAMMYYNLGYMYHLKNETDSAIPLYRKSLEIDPYYIYALQELSKYYYSTGNQEEFRRYYSRLLELERKISTGL